MAGGCARDQREPLRVLPFLLWRLPSDVDQRGRRLERRKRRNETSCGRRFRNIFGLRCRIVNGENHILSHGAL